MSLVPLRYRAVFFSMLQCRSVGVAIAAASLPTMHAMSGRVQSASQRSSPTAFRYFSACSSSISVSSGVGGPTSCPWLHGVDLGWAPARPRVSRTVLMYSGWVMRMSPLVALVIVHPKYFVGNPRRLMLYFCFSALNSS